MTRHFGAAALLAATLILPGMACAAPVATLTVGAPEEAGRAVLQFGGGVWRVPKVSLLAEPLIDALGPQGTWRAALAWEVLAPARSPDQVDRLLDGYPLNDFLAARARAGGRVIITLDAMPKFLARDRSEAKAGDGPAWARSPPAREEGWADVVSRVVRHFRGLGIDAIYEVWNEPDHSFRGGIDDYVALYRATVLGARRVDAKAQIGGPAISDWTANDGAGGRWIESFLSHAAATPVPEIGLKRLPVDAVTYHSFNRVPGRHHARVMSETQALLTRHGYGARPVINSEWNIAPEPPYPEGDLNGGAAGAAHIGATLIAMQRAGIDRQVFQMTVDPGAKGYSAGVLTAAGTTRAAWHAFRMVADAASGRQLSVITDDASVDALAFRDGTRLSVLVAVFPPTPLMLARESMEPLALSDPGSFAEITALPRRQIEAFMFRGGTPSSGRSAAARAALIRGWEDYRTALAAQETWQKGGDIRIRLPTPARLVSHRVIDQATAPGPQSVARADDATNSEMRSLMTRTEKDLRALGADRPEVRAYGDALGRRLDGRAALDSAPAQTADRLRQIDADWIDAGRARLAALRRTQADRLVVPVPEGGAQAEVTITTEAPALHLLVFE